MIGEELDEALSDRPRRAEDAHAHLPHAFILERAAAWLAPGVRIGAVVGMPLVDRKAQEEREDRLFAPYGMRSANSRGRRHAEPEDELRTRYQRDRDRVIHSSSFRRLEYKTQVFVNHEGDNYRTRLTHSLEAAQIGRTVARALGLNEELTECLVLGHDLGHTPFGHSG